MSVAICFVKDDTDDVIATVECDAVPPEGAVVEISRVNADEHFGRWRVCEPGVTWRVTMGHSRSSLTVLVRLRR